MATPRSKSNINKKINHRNKLNKNKTIYSEFVCIGAGVSNAYACYKLRRNNIHHGNIIVLEKSDRFGGRIQSKYTNTIVQNKPEVGYDEFGAMRLFDIASMKKIFDLIRIFKLTTIQISLEDKENIFYYKGKKFLKKDARLSNGMKICELEDYIIENIRIKYPEMDFNDIYDYEEFRHANRNKIVKKYGHVNTKDLHMWISYMGYDIDLENGQSSTWLYEKKFYNTLYFDKQYYILNGMISLVRKLFEHSNAKIVYSTKAISIEKDAIGRNIVNTINSNYEYVKYKCKYLFIGVTPDQLRSLNTYTPIQISSSRLRLAFESISYPLFKVFLKWDKSNIWWGGDKYITGKSTTDLLIRQVHYYNDEDILVYNSGRYATELYLKFSENPEKAAIEVFEQLKIMHRMDIPPPNFAYTTFQYWPVGGSQWLVGADVNKNVELIPNGAIDNSNIYIVGDSFSKNQGWIIGAIDSVDIALKYFRK